ncbi:MAG: hypothetical protein WBD32_04545, partial [Acidobacteriaceae bacterium]
MPEVLPLPRVGICGKWLNSDKFRETRFGMWQTIENKPVASGPQRAVQPRAVSQPPMQKAALRRPFSVSTPLLSEYQVQTGFLSDLGGYFGVQVTIFQR